MATLIKYNILKDINDEEIKGNHQLTARFQLFFGVWTFLISIVGFKFDELLNSSTIGILSLLIAALLFLVLTLFFIILGLRLHKWEGICDVHDVVLQLNESEIEQSDKDFLDDRLADMAVAYERNSKLNNKRGKYLNKATWCTIASVICEVILFSFYSLGS